VKAFRDLSRSFPGEFAPFLSGVAIVDDVLIQVSWKSSLLPDPVLFFDHPFSVGVILSLGSLSYSWYVCVQGSEKHSSCGPRLTEYLVPCMGCARTGSVNHGRC
jgi:hypothetical protein